MSGLLPFALIAALGVIAWLLVQHAVYRARHKWSDADIEAARHDSVTRSRSVVSGKVQEHLAPLCPEFLDQFNPKDARFLGTPIDFVVFDGLDEGYVRNVCFIEVKTGRAAVSARERHVRAAVEAGKVSFQVMRLPSVANDPLPGYDETRGPANLAAPDAPPALQP
jgi:predicted Holliday junction resolvase-like endonuclease